MSVVVGLLQHYGLPLTILVAFAWALFTGRLVLGSEITKYKEELAYRETLRSQERASREEAEQRLADMVEVLRQHTELLSDIEREVIRGQGRSGGAG